MVATMWDANTSRVASIRSRPFLTLAGTPIHIHRSSFVLVALVFSGGVTVPTAIPIVLVGLFGGVLWHEFGHVLAVRRLRNRPSVIHVYALGGLASWSDPRPVPPGELALIALAGPSAGAVMGLAFLALAQFFAATGPNLAGALELVALLNIGLAVFNLLPILPLDGGQLLRGVLTHVRGRSSEMPMRIVSVVFCVVVIAVGVALRRWWLVALIGFMLVDNVQHLWRARDEAEHEALHDLHTHLLATNSALRRGDGAAALASVQGLRAVSGAEGFQVAAIMREMWAQLLAGRIGGALAAVDQLPAGGAPGRVLTPAVTRRIGTPVALAALERQWTTSPGTTTGMLLVVARLEAGDLSGALKLVRGAADHLDAPTIATVGLASFRAGDHTAAASLAEVVFQRTGHPVAAHNVALSHLRAGDHDEAVQWLRRAVAAGLSADVLREPIYADLRHHPAIADLLAPDIG